MSKTTSPYSIFARIYDKTMSDVPYHHWAYFIYKTFDKYQIHTGEWVVDIGSGTGTVAAKLAAYYKLIAADISENMLQFAKNYSQLQCIQAEMIQLPFKSESIGAAYSTHDCVNYLTSEEKVSDHLKEVHRVLKNKGIYILDFSTEYNVIKYFHNRTFEERHGNLYMKWANVYDREKKIVTSIIDVEEYPSQWFGRFMIWNYKKYREVHIQKIFDEGLMAKLCKENGFKLMSTSYDYNEQNMSQNPHLVVFTLRKS